MTKNYIMDEDMKEFCYYLEFYDLNGKFPWEKTRIDITISQEALNKLKGKERSKFIDELILSSKN